MLLDLDLRLAYSHAHLVSTTISSFNFVGVHVRKFSDQPLGSQADDTTINLLSANVCMYVRMCMYMTVYV